MHLTRNINIFCVFIEAACPSWHLLQREWLWFSPSLLPPSLPPPFSLPPPPPFPLLSPSFSPSLLQVGILWCWVVHSSGPSWCGAGAGHHWQRNWRLQKQNYHYNFLLVSIISQKTWPLVVSHYQSWSLATCSLKLRVSILDFAFSKAAIQNPKRNTGVWV